MDKSLENRIDAFLKKQMSEQESTRFAQEMKSSPSLADQVASRRLEMEVLELMLEDDLRSKLGKWQNDIQDTPKMKDKEPSPSHRKWIGVMIGLLVLAFVGYWFFTQRQIVSPPEELPPAKHLPEQPEHKSVEESVPVPPLTQPKEQLPEKKEHSTPKKKNQNQLSPKIIAQLDIFEKEVDYPFGVTKSATSSQTLLDSAILLTNKGKLTNAVNVLQQIDKTAPIYIDAQYYLGLIHFKQNNYKNAIPYFLTVTLNKNYLYIDEVQWLTALAQLKAGHTQTGQNSLNQILNDPEHSYFDKAKLLKYH